MTDLGSAESHDAPECVDCGGKCCEDFTLHLSNDGRPWVRKRVRDEIARQIADDGLPYVITGEAFIYGEIAGIEGFGVVMVPVSCSWFVEGRCAHYADRPPACRRFPHTSVEDGLMLTFDCPLFDRLRREMQEAAAK